MSSPRVTPAGSMGGYLIDGNFFSVSRQRRAGGLWRSLVTSGQIIGFRAGSVDDQSGIPGILTITDFSVSAPEPGTFVLMLLAAAGAKIARICVSKTAGTNAPNAPPT